MKYVGILSSFIINAKAFDFEIPWTMPVGKVPLFDFNYEKIVRFE